jgi:hypothetical protein
MRSLPVLDAAPPRHIRETRSSAREVKFLLTAACAADVRAWARERLAADPHGTGPHQDEYETTSLYFDTPDLDVLRRQGSYGRAKYRIRRYGSADQVFLERKLRTGALLAKRRSLVHVRDLQRFGPQAAGYDWAGRWFEERLVLRRLQPAAQVTYRRMARVWSGPAGSSRLTLDHCLTAVPAGTIAFRAGVRGVPLTEGLILEIKYRGDFPSVFKELLERFGLSAAAVSKYRMAAEALGIGGAAGPVLRRSGLELATV